MHVYDAPPAIPTTFLELVGSSGVIGWLVFLSIPFLLLIGLILLIFPHHRAAWMYFCFAWIPFGLGIGALSSGVLSVLNILAHNPGVTQMDLLAGLHVSAFPFLAGVVISGIALSVACLMLARTSSANPKGSAGGELVTSEAAKPMCTVEGESTA